MTSRTERIPRAYGAGAVLALGFLLAAAPATAMTLEEVIAKHVEAHGGRQNWQSIRSMKIAGTFAAFSKVSPFTMLRKRDDKYHLDSTQNDRKVEVGYDGRTAWWDNHWMQEGAQTVSGPDLQALTRDFDFTPPLFDYEERGFTVKLLGETEYEGIPAIGIELTRDDDTVETWYLDPKTYLAAARTSPGSDFGQPMTQRSFFDDYREVAGVKIPFYTETQWYTRDRVMRVDSVETNIDIDDAIFRMPAPLGMGPFQTLAGTWHVAVSQRQQPGADWEESERSSTIEPLLGGGLFQETFTGAAGDGVVRTLSYDRFHERYRLTEINSRDTQMDVREGEFDENGRLTMSNKETGTMREQFGMQICTRLSIFDITDDAFEVETEVSIDGGENWWVAGKASYKRAED